MERLNLSIIAILLLASSCFANEGEINIGTGNAQTKGEGIDTGLNDPKLGSEGVDDQSGDPVDDSNSSNALFVENFDYYQNDGVSIDTNFLTRPDFQSKWSVYQKSGVTQKLETINNDVAWGPIGINTHWLGSIITKETYSFPVTIEWDMYQENNYSSGTSMDGICIYEGSSVTRDSKYGVVVSSTNYGCLGVFRYSQNSAPALVPTGFFYNSSNPDLTTYSKEDSHEIQNDYSKAYLIGTHSLRDYRFTVSVAADNSITITVQFKDGTNQATKTITGSVNTNTTNFHIEFYSGDYQNYRIYFTSIKESYFVVAATSIN